jgi:hypothetical protein
MLLWTMPEAAAAVCIRVDVPRRYSAVAEQRCLCSTWSALVHFSLLTAACMGSFFDIELHAYSLRYCDVG